MIKKLILRLKKKLILIPLLVLVFLALWRLWPVPTSYLGINLFTSDNGETLESFVPIDQSAVECLAGLPHQQHEFLPYLSALITGPREVIHGHPFHPDPIDAELTQSFAEILSSRSSFEQWIGPKACGAFHGDYYVQWGNGVEKWEVILCMGCHEALLFHDDRSIRVDLSKDGGAKLERLLYPNAGPDLTDTGHD